MKTFIQIVLGVFTILAALYGVNTAQSALKAAKERPPELRLTMPVVHDQVLTQKVDNSANRLDNITERLVALEKSVSDLVVKSLQVKPVVEEPKVEPPPVVESNKVVIDKDDPKPTTSYEYLLFCLPDNQCPACVSLKKRLNTKEFTDKYKLVPSTKTRFFGIRSYPTIAVFDPKANKYRKFESAGLSVDQVINNIENSITILERP